MHMLMDFQSHTDTHKITFGHLLQKKVRMLVTSVPAVDPVLIHLFLSMKIISVNVEQVSFIT